MCPIPPPVTRRIREGSLHRVSQGIMRVNILLRETGPSMPISRPKCPNDERMVILKGAKQTATLSPSCGICRRLSGLFWGFPICQKGSQSSPGLCGLVDVEIDPYGDFLFYSCRFGLIGVSWPYGRFLPLKPPFSARNLAAS